MRGVEERVWVVEGMVDGRRRETTKKWRENVVCSTHTHKLVDAAALALAGGRVAKG